MRSGQWCVNPISMQTFNEYLREEYHNVAELMWRSGQNKFYGDLPQR